MSPRAIVVRARRMPWTILMGVLIGVTIAPGGGTDWVWAAYDRWRPVVAMTGQIVERGDGFVVVRITGTKHRPCQFLAMRAYAAQADGTLADINTARIDRAEDGHTKPTGTFYFGDWRAWPTSRATGVQWHVSHSCDGRLVTTRVAEVTL